MIAVVFGVAFVVLMFDAVVLLLALESSRGREVAISRRSNDPVGRVSARVGSNPTPATGDVATVRTCRHAYLDGREVVTR